MSTETDHPAPNDEKRGLLDGNPAWGFFVMGILFIGVSIWFFVDLTNLEAEGGERQVHWLMLLLYTWFGKWGVVVPPFLFGFAMFVGGVIRLFQKE